MLCGGNHLMICLGIGEFSVNSSMGLVSYLKLHVLNLGAKTYSTHFILWVWMEVDGFRDCWICKLEL